MAALAFFLNFVWEMWQIPFFEGKVDVSHGEGVKECTRATVADVVIALAAFSASSIVAASRRWFVAPRRREIFVFLGVGLLITVGLEELATGPLGRWEYSALMPVLPWIGTGVIPLRDIEESGKAETEEQARARPVPQFTAENLR